MIIPEGGERDARGLAERILRAFSKTPFVFEGKTVNLSASIGIAAYPLHAASAKELVANADAAMFQAKAAGKNAWCV